MRQTSREIIRQMVLDGRNLALTEVALGLPQRTLRKVCEEEGPASPELEALLNIINTFPIMTDVAWCGFRKQTGADSAPSESMSNQTKTTKNLKQRLLARQTTAELNRKAAKARRRGFWTVEDINASKRNAKELYAFLNKGFKL